MSLFADVAHIFVDVLLPVLLMVGLGVLVQRFHPLEGRTLSRVQVYGLVPAFQFVRVYESTLSWSQMGRIALAVFLSQLALAVPLYLLLRARKVKPDTMAVVLLASVVFNAGNFGIPVMERAFGAAGGAVQALVVMIANLSLWGIGYTVMAAVTGKGKSALLGYFKLPMVYCMAAALALRALHTTLPPFVIYTCHTIADSLVALALISLGAQLAARHARAPLRWRAILPVALGKLVLLPLITAGVVIAFGLWPWPGAALVLAAAAPSAVNTLLLAIEQDGDAELAADCVFATTLLSVITVTFALALLRFLGGAALPTPAG